MGRKLVVICIFMPLLLWQQHCGLLQPPPPKWAGSQPLTAQMLVGSWINEAMELVITFRGDGKFTWKQGQAVEEGNYTLAGTTLYMTVASGKTTVYQVVAFTEDGLSLRDPRGVVAHLERADSEGEEGSGFGGAAASGAKPAPPPAPAPLVDLRQLYGSWSGPYGIELQFREDGSFNWRQPDYAVEGKFTVEGAFLNLIVEGNPTSYRILSLGPQNLLIADPKNNEVALSKLVPSPQPAPAPVPAQTAEPTPPPISTLTASLAKGKEVEISEIEDAKSIFFVEGPKGWKALLPEGCDFPCGEPTVLTDQAGRTITVLVEVFATKAGSGALRKLVPSIDTIMGAFSKNREKTVDSLTSMGGLEAFSRRFTGKTADESQVMISRIVGIHYKPYLLVGVVLTSAKAGMLTSLRPVMEGIIDSLSFNLAPEGGLSDAIVGTWFGASKEAKELLSVQSKHLYIFYPDGKFIHAVASDQFVPKPDNIKNLLVGSSSSSGQYKVVGSSVILEYDATASVRDAEVEIHPVRLEGSNKLRIGYIVMEKVTF